MFDVETSVNVSGLEMHMPDVRRGGNCCISDDVLLLFDCSFSPLSAAQIDQEAKYVQRNIKLSSQESDQCY
jgi:hypothetical protein